MPYRISSNGRALFALKNNVIPFGCPALYLSGKVNDGKADKLSATKLVTSNYPDILQVLPKGKMNIYSVQIPNVMANSKLSYNHESPYVRFYEGKWLISDNQGITFNSGLLSIIAGKFIKIGVIDESKPVVFWDSSTEYPYDADWFYVVMPMRGGVWDKPSFVGVQEIFLPGEKP